MKNEALLFIGGALDGERHWIDATQTTYVSTAGPNFDTVRYVRTKVVIEGYERSVMIPELTAGCDALALLVDQYKKVDAAPVKEQTTTLDDTDPMPFGKYKGKPMQDVPASYLHWLYCAGAKDPVKAYIEKNLTALRQEHPDGVWEYKEK